AHLQLAARAATLTGIEAKPRNAAGAARVAWCLAVPSNRFRDCCLTALPPSSQHNRAKFCPKVGSALSLLPNETPQEQAFDATAPGAEDLGPVLARGFKAYGPDAKRSILQLVTTAAAFIALLVVMASASHDHY